MFSLLVAFQKTAWESSARMSMDLDRFKEYSHEESKLISLENPNTLKFLEMIPALLMYEKESPAPNKSRVRLGRIRDLEVVRGELVFRFEEEGSIKRDVIEEAAERLRIDDFEFHRTHWALKDGSIPADILSQSAVWRDDEISTLPDPPPEYDLIAQVDFLKAGLLRVASGGKLPTPEFVRVRRLLIGCPPLTNLIPDFLKQSRTAEEAIGFLTAEHGAGERRDETIRTSLNALAQALEDHEGVVALADYENLGAVGHGGFGVVYRFRHKLLNEDFAVKVFAPVFNQWEEGNLARFFREARILLRLHHPNIIRFFETGMLGLRPYIRTEFFGGKTLAKRIAEEGLLAPDVALELVTRLTRALDHAHSRDVVHRDLRPENIMVNGDDLRIIDFGLGVLLSADLVSRITLTGQHPAGGAYAAPELASDPTIRDPATDVYSIGAVWFFALTGSPPSTGLGLSRWLTEESAVPDSHRTVIASCLDEPDRRLGSAGTLLTALEKL